MKIDLAALAKEFENSELEWRVQSCGTNNGNAWARILCYVTNRAIMNRLDKVCGPGNWRNEFKHVNGGVLSSISIRVGRVFRQWVTKWDGSEETDIESFKGGLSASMKRTAVQWGIGRYLYELEAGFAETSDIKTEIHTNYCQTKEGVKFFWSSPIVEMVDGKPVAKKVIPDLGNKPEPTKPTSKKKPKTKVKPIVKDKEPSPVATGLMKMSVMKVPELCRQFLRDNGYNTNEKVYSYLTHQLRIDLSVKIPDWKPLYEKVKEWEQQNVK